MDSMDLNSVPIHPPSIEKLDTVKRKSERPPNSTGSKSTAQHPLTGACLGKGHRHCVDPGANVEEVFKPDQPDFQKASVGHLKIPTHFSLLKRDEQKRWTVKISLALGYISYDATTFPWVTFSYELTGWGPYLSPWRRQAQRVF